jgi:hypothetical protein
VFGVANVTQMDDPDVNTFSNQQIFKFADALAGKDLTKNQFLYYTGEIYDSVSVVFDEDFWSSAMENFVDVLDWGWETTKNNVPAIAYGTGGLAAIQGSIWTHALLTFSLDMSWTLATVGGAITTTSTAPIVEAGFWASRTTSLANAGQWIISRLASPTIWLAIFDIAVIAALGYALWGAADREKNMHKDRLEMLLYQQYATFLADAMVALVNGGGVGDSFRTKAKDPVFLKKILTIFGIDKEIERRVVIWNRFSFELSRDENFLDDPIAAKTALDDAIGKAFANIPLPDIDDLSDDDGWAFLGDVGGLLQKKQPNFDSRNYGFQKLTPLIKSIPAFEIERRVKLMKLLEKVESNLNNNNYKQ